MVVVTMMVATMMIIPPTHISSLTTRIPPLTPILSPVPSCQVCACQKVFQAAHTVLLGDLKSCEPVNIRGKNKGDKADKGDKGDRGENNGVGRSVRSLKWLQPQFDSNVARYAHSEI